MIPIKLEKIGLKQNKFIDIRLEFRFYDEMIIEKKIKEFKQYVKLSIISKEKESLIVRFLEDGSDNELIKNEFLNHLIFMMGKK